jgi:hypothetical protein
VARRSSERVLLVDAPGDQQTEVVAGAYVEQIVLAAG